MLRPRFRFGVQNVHEPLIADKMYLNNGRALGVPEIGVWVAGNELFDSSTCVKYVGGINGIFFFLGFLWIVEERFEEVAIVFIVFGGVGSLVSREILELARAGCEEGGFGKGDVYGVITVALYVLAHAHRWYIIYLLRGRVEYPLPPRSSLIAVSVV
jgi:hypothetical protein